MPVWHDVTKEARASDLITIVGITQEQHPDRCRLFAQWQGLDWPILWDPFNLTESSAVPIVLVVDEFGRIQERPNPRDFEDGFLYADFEEEDHPQPPKPEVEHAHARAELDGRSSAIARLLWGSGAWSAEDERHAALERLRARVDAGLRL